MIAQNIGKYSLGILIVMKDKEASECAKQVAGIGQHSFSALSGTYQRE
jgi:hypothetical protein